MADRFKKERATYFNWNTYDRPLDQSRLGDGSDFTITSYPMGGNCATDPAHCLPQNATRVVLTDLNGDGMDDVLYSLADPSTANAVRLKVRMGGVNGLGDETDAGVAFNAGEAAGLDGAATGDFDGDGRSEIIWDRLNWTSTPPSGSFPGYYPSGQPATHVVSRWNGTALETIPSSSALSWIVSTHWAPYWDHTALMDPRAVRIADFNGDGILDLLGGSTDSNDRSAPQEIWLGMNHNSFNAFAGPLTGPRPGVNVSQILGYTKPLFFGDVDGDGRADILTTPVADRRGIFFTDLNGDGLVEELDFAAMESHVECSNKNVSVKVEANTGRIPTWLNPSFPTPYTAALQVPSGVGACSMLTPSELHLDYAQSVRSGDFNGDGLQDILLLNVGVDGGTTVYARGIGLQATKPADCGHCPDGSVVQCWEQATHREKGKAHSIHPVLLLATGDTTQPFVSTVLPLQGARFREETFSTTPDFFEGGTCFSGPHLVVPGSSNWESHFWNGTAVGDINGDGLADVVQMVLDGGAMKLETITAKKQELGLTHRKDVIVQVLDGLKSRTGSGPALAEQIQYGDLAAMATLGSYTVPSTCAMSSSPTGAGCLLKGTVVSTFSPLGRQATRINYRYEAARVDPKGRGVFGFDKIVENDTGFGVRKTTTKTFKRAVSALDDSFGTTTYAAASLAPVADAHFPRFVSWNDALPPPISPHMYWTQQQTVETVHSDLVFTGGFSTPAPLQRVVTTTTNELVSSPMPFRPAANSFYVRPLKIDVSDSYIAAATSAGQTQAADLHRTIDYVYDDYSNPKQVTTTVDGGTSERVVTQYNNDTANWFIGQPKHIEHYAYPGATFDPSNVRTTDYLYWNDGRLQTETVEPTADPTADLNKVTNYGRGHRHRLVDLDHGAADADHHVHLGRRQHSSRPDHECAQSGHLADLGRRPGRPHVHRRSERGRGRLHL
jgi:hypothetical protein